MEPSSDARRGQQRPRGPRIDPPITTQPSDGRGSVEQPSSDARGSEGQGAYVMGVNR